jgi:uncharacterized protein YukE
MNKSQQIIHSLNSKIHGLEDRWDGMTKQRFFQYFSEAKKNMDNLVQLLDSLDSVDLGRFCLFCSYIK